MREETGLERSDIDDRDVPASLAQVVRQMLDDLPHGRGVLRGKVEILARPVDNAMGLDGIASHQGESERSTGGECVQQQAAVMVRQVVQCHAGAAGRSCAKRASQVVRTPRPSILRRVGQYATSRAASR